MTDRPTTYRILASSGDCRQAALQLANQARRSLALFSRDLEPVIYDTADFVAAVQQLALRSRYSHIRMLVIDPQLAVSDGHRLIELTRRLSSYMEIRRPSEDHAKLAEAFLISDDTGLMFRPLASRFEGFADPDDPSQARNRLRQFDEIWEAAEPEQEFRRLGL
ncbi:MAG: acyltransferase [Gammaproteobacteria bacterium]|nr:acyltransferase [Gammaproteobacteria bacterium]MDE2023910.1 acyltransferase [Gammaproteobacteria bacterium]MDE2139163.1 acyltransferase [Gammaproteobacteria bacterium]MDE2274129.1 acyltransferase [Gammaproteobacteria bacterium]